MNHQKHPLVSIVTPMYNAEKYLVECIESVLSQTYENWEYAIINNCSTDRSLEIAQHYADQDSRICVHDNSEFLNQMQNWNHAMRQISPQSQYCKVLHADDWLFPDCLNQMVAVAEAHPSVGIIGSYRLDENEVNLDGLPYPSTIIPGREICRRTLMGDIYVFGSPSSLLIRSDFVLGTTKFYDETIIQADKKVCFDILQEADFGFVHQVLTFTRRHNESMSSAIHRFNTRRTGRLIYLQRYGPIFLNQQEFEQEFRKQLDNHYRYLARSVFQLREREFWNYQKNELATMGYPINWVKLAKSCAVEILNIKDTMMTLKRAMLQSQRYEKPQSQQKWNEVRSSIYVQEESH